MQPREEPTGLSTQILYLCGNEYDMDDTCQAFHFLNLRYLENPFCLSLFSTGELFEQGVILPGHLKMLVYLVPESRAGRL